jgi:hypothetical protein
MCISIPDKPVVFFFPSFRFLLISLVGLFFLLNPSFSPAREPERRMDLGLGVERAMNTIGGNSLGPRISFLADINSGLAAGARAGYSHNLADIQTLEAAALCRWYFFSFRRDPAGDGPPESRLFAQIETGLDLILNDGRGIPAFLGGLSAGWRYNYGSWFFESSLRVGYPNIWGGVLLGFGYRI